MNTKNKNKLLLWGIKLCLLAWLFSFSGEVCASEQNIIINEIMFNPSGIDGNTEWVELYNNGGLTIDLSGWDLDPDSGSYFSLDGKIIGGNEYLLIGGLSKMRNDKGQVSLYKSKTHTAEMIVDYVQYGSSDLGSTENKVRDRAIEAKIWEEAAFFKEDFLEEVSLERIKDGHDEDISSDWQISYETGGTPGKENSKKMLPKEYSKEIRINEIFPDPSGSDDGKEFIEIYNAGDKSENLKNWKLEDSKGEGKLLPEKEIGSGEYLYFLEKDSGITLTNTYGKKILLTNPNGEMVSEMEYAIPAKEDYSYSFNGKMWKWTSEVTPEKENIFDPESYSTGIYINEFLPNPSEGSDEYVEIYNSLANDFNLSKWILHDSSKTGKYIFPKGSNVKAKDYLVLYKKDFGFALNDSGEEKISLIDPLENEVSNVGYSGGKEGISYNFNGKDWHRSKFLTPGKKNKFNNIPETKIKKDKKIYTNMHADFDAKVFDADGDRTKVTWDFGDGHKSYLKKTKHKYEKAGIYAASLKSSDGSEDKLENFQVTVEDFPKRKVKIVALSPNPEGKDSDLEWIEIKNESKKKVNLKDWSVATGWKKLYNHPINLDFIIEPGKTGILAREYSAFTLNNKKDKIELRYPDGEVADKLKYNKKKESITDDEVYRKVKKKKWAWEKEKNNSIEVEVQENIQISEKAEVASDEASTTNPEVESNPVIMEDEIEDETNASEIEIENEINDDQAFLYSENNPFIQGKVLGVEIMNNNAQIYKSENKNNLEWSHSLFLIINGAINRIISLI